MIRVLDIEVPAAAADTAAEFEVRVLVDADGQQEWFGFRASPLGMPGSDARVVEADGAFLDRYRGHGKVVHHIRRLVGQAVARGSVHLPQLIAA